MPKNPPGKPKSNSAATELVALAVKGMEQAFGLGTAITPDSKTVLCKIDTWASLGNFIIDQAIAGGNPIPGGIPFGRLTEVAGRAGAGKTSLLGHAVVATQKMGGIACIADTEQALDLSYWEKLGVDLSHLVLFQATTIEEMFEKAEHLITLIKASNAEAPVLLGWDSLGGTPTKAQLEASSSDHFYAEAAKVVGKNLQKLIYLISKEKIALVFTNHLYRDINVKYGDTWVSYGGEKVQFYASLRIRLIKGSAIKEGSPSSSKDDKEAEDRDTIGHLNRIQILKNKMSPILRTVQVPCLGNYGFSQDYTIFDQASRLKIIEKNKAWYKWQPKDSEEISFQGWSGFQKKVLIHPQYKDLVEEVKAKYIASKTVDD